MTAIPTGTVTFLFTDVVGSSELWQEHPLEMATSLARHDEIVRTAIVDHGGHVFSTAGDAFAAAFSSAVGAVAAAVEAQRQLGSEPWGSAVIGVRMGIHTGTAEERGENYFGPTVNRAARIMALGGAGQVLVSSATHELIAGSLPDGVHAVDSGEHALRSMSRSERVFTLGGEGLSDAPLGPPSAAAVGNLPAGVSDMVGRSDDIARILGEAGPGRLVTLTGIGGAGKTQLATKVAAALASEFPDGGWWCDLTPIRSPDLVPNAIASAVALVPSPEMQPVDAVVDALSRRRLVLVVDNCEHLVTPVAEVLDAIGQRCAGVAVIATSREPIGVGHEMVWPVQPLDPETAAVDLLVRRAVSNDRSLSSDDWNRDELVELCRRLDGIPLAIEMAAARLRSMSPQQIIERIDDRFRLLRSRRRDGADRHQTLLAMLDWSYHLLDVEEQTLLDRLGVFADVFDLDTAEKVCADELLDALDVADLLATLVDKSLVSTVRSGTRTRYRLLETVRQYGRSHLEERDELDRWLRRHADAIVELCADAFERFRDDRFWSGKETYDDNWSDVVAAMEWAVREGDSLLFARLLRSCGEYFFQQGKSEVGELAVAALDLPDAEPAAYWAASFFASDAHEQVRLAELGLRCDPLEDLDRFGLTSQLAAGRALAGVGGVFEAVSDATEQAYAVGSQLDQAYWEAIIAEGAVSFDVDFAQQSAERATSLLDGRMDHPNAAAALGRLAGFHARTGNHDEALTLCDQASDLAGEASAKVWRAYTVALAARISAVADEPEAAERLRAAIAEARDSGWWFNVWPAVSTAGRWFEEHGRLQASAVIDGYFERTGWRRHDFDLAPPQDVDRSAYAVHTREGASMSGDQLVDFVLQHLSGSEPAVGATPIVTP